jgi:hypothetical protein
VTDPVEDQAPTPTTGPFITQNDEYMAGSKDPLAIGSMKIRNKLNHMGMLSTTEEIRQVAEDVIELKETYEKWANFYNDLRARKARLVGFRSVLLALDMTAFAAAVGTSEARLTGVMQAQIASEETRMNELQELWDRGELPDRPVLTDPSKEVIDPDLTD